MSNRTEGKQLAPSTTTVSVAPKNGNGKKTEKPKPAHDRWEEYERFVSEFKAAKNQWPTITEAVTALQKKRPLASEKDWKFVASYYDVVKGKDEKEEPRVTSNLSDTGCQLALQTMATGKAHSLWRLHQKEVEAYAKRTNKPLPTIAKKAEKKAPKGGKK